MIHKSSYLQGYVKKSVLRLWLEYLLEQSLYKRYNVTFDRDRIKSVSRESAADEDDNIETLQTERACESDIVAARQRTLRWNEDKCFADCSGTT